MTPEAINRAIAESVGWKLNQTEVSGLVDVFWSPPGEEPCAFTHCHLTPPNYHGDLNAIQPVIAKIKDGRHISDYMMHLYDIVERDAADGELVLHLVFRQINATAPQRCEAYMKTYRMWREA